MAVRIELINLKEKKRIPAIRCEGTLTRDLGEAVAEMLPTLLEIGTPLSQISTMLWGKEC